MVRVQWALFHLQGAAVFPTEAEVVVIGGGVLGTSAAFQLADAGQRNVVLLDKGPLANGTTPFAAGQTGYLKTDPAALEFSRYCVEFFENFEQRTGYPIDFRQVGSVRVALTEAYRADIEARVKAAESIGDHVEMLTPAELKKRVPTVALEQAAGILFVPRDGYVEPRSVAVAYAAAARDRGVAFHTRTDVTGLEIVDGRVRAVHTPRGTIKTAWVVLAAGAWTRQFAQQIGLNVKSVPVRHQAFVTAPIKGVLADQPIVRFTEPQLYIRNADGGLMVGGYGYRPLSFDMNDFPDDFAIPSLEPDRIYYDQLAEAAGEYFPALHDAVIVQERRGLPTMAPDGHFIAAELEQAKGLVVASACSVGGIHHSPGIGRVVADIITGRPAWAHGAALNADRFRSESDDDVRLRSQCETAYARMYLDVL